MLPRGAAKQIRGNTVFSGDMNQTDIFIVLPIFSPWEWVTTDAPRFRLPIVSMQNGIAQKAYRLIETGRL